MTSRTAVSCSCASCATSCEAHRELQLQRATAACCSQASALLSVLCRLGVFVQSGGACAG